MNIKKQGIIAVLLLIFLLVFFACSSDETNSSDSSNQVSSSSSMTSSMASSQDDALSQKAEMKNIRLNVIVNDNGTETFDITTDAENLREALEQEGLIAGDESDFGLFVTSVNGITADAEKKEWWCLTKDGEMWSYGVDTTELSDGDVFDFTLTKDY